MEVLEGLFFINDTDVYARFGAFLAETAEDRHDNYDSLLAPPTLKEQPEVSFREENGVRTPDTLTQAFDARDIMLRIAITAPDDTAFLSRYVAFVNFLKSGDNGYLTLRLADVGMEFRVYAVGFSDYSQLIPFGNGEIAASFSVKFREPKPTFFGPVQQTGK